jgi:lincosamide nucleotidyltransferase A/C/D/E
MPMAADDVVDVLDRLGAAGVDASIAGGWAVDALLGRTTREHGDLDLAVDARDIDPAIEALEAAGFRIEVDERPARLGLGDGRRAIDLHPVRWDADGTGRQSTGTGDDFVYPPGSTEARGWIRGREVRCLTPELLLTFHLGYEPRDIDRRDMAALAERYGLDSRNRTEREGAARYCSEGRSYCSEGSFSKRDDLRRPGDGASC